MVLLILRVFRVAVTLVVSVAAVPRSDLGRAAGCSDFFVGFPQTSSVVRRHTTTLSSASFGLDLTWLSILFCRIYQWLSSGPYDPIGGYAKFLRGHSNF